MKRAFSLVEVLAAVSLIGILVFLALPNIVQVKQDAEEKLVESRCDAMNLAAASFVQAVGTTTAKSAWTTAGSESNPVQARYELLRPYLAYAPTNVTATDGTGYMPVGWTVSMPGAIVPLSEITPLAQ